LLGNEAFKVVAKGNTGVLCHVLSYSSVYPIIPYIGISSKEKRYLDDCLNSCGSRLTVSVDFIEYSAAIGHPVDGGRDPHLFGE
jgi:hypothetical protein